MIIPITFPDDEVRAILSGVQIQTRRVVIDVDPKIWKLRVVGHGGEVSVATFTPITSRSAEPLFVWCPFGKPGADLRVRETWAAMDHMAGIGTHSIDPPCVIGYRASATAICHELSDRHQPTPREMDVRSWNFDAPSIHWRSPQHLYKWASRIFLQVESIHIERLQKISGDDARAQGCKVPNRPGVPNERIDAFCVDKFRKQWNATKHRRVFHKWDRDPFVWVIRFKRTKVLP